MIPILLILAVAQMVSVYSAEECRGGCKTCYSGIMNSVCTSCKDGHFVRRMGQYHECIRCDYVCVTCTFWGHCQECQPGRYGLGCEHSCGEGCVNNTCEKETGSCQCMELFTGEACENCTLGLYGTGCLQFCNDGCVNNTCEKDTGECVCKNGFTGLNCSQCIAGRYGPFCQLECSNGCKDGSCDLKTGQCVCKPDYVGEKCNKCSAGTYYANATCSNKCPSNCQRCKSDQHCLECKSGYYGSSCQLSCPPYCLNGECSIAARSLVLVNILLVCLGIQARDVAIV